MAKNLDKVIVVDLESTCWRESPPQGQTSEIIEIGVAVLDMRTLIPEGKRSILVKPLTSHVSDFCTQLTTLTADQLEREGVTLAQACKILKSEYEGKSRVWASWGDYDRRQLERDCKAKGIGYPFGPTHLNAKALFSLLRQEPREHGMAEALELLGLKLEGTHHRGHDDAWNIAKIMSAMFA